MILDKADALRAKRRGAIAQLDALKRAISLEMFGDPVANKRGWPVQSLGDVISLPLRNGLSPSKRGKCLAKVLTLSAITGDMFDESARESRRRSTVFPLLVRPLAQTISSSAAATEMFDWLGKVVFRLAFCLGWLSRTR